MLGSAPWTSRPRLTRNNCAASSASGCAPICRGSTARDSRLASRIWPRKSPSADGGKASWPSAGWVGVTWPAAVGGRGLGPAENFVVQEELARARAPELVGRIGVNLAGPTMLDNGTEEQKARWLPGILPAAELWCQLFSEPDAGSDLASVRTAARRCDGGWRLSGRKVWTSYAQFADWGVCLARSDQDAPKHKGMSFFVVDMHSRRRHRSSPRAAHRRRRVQRGGAGRRLRP